MSDRVNGLVITLEKDIRLDDMELLMQSIRFMRGVANVEANVVNSSDWINQQRIKCELKEKMYKFIHDNL